jgi:hypothetical protein
VRASDPAGHTDATPATAAWVVDATVPDTIIDSAPSGVTTATDATIAFHATKAGSTLTCQLDGAAPVACGSPAIINGLGVGTHTFAVWATDTVGRVDASPAGASWTVQAPPPPPPPPAGGEPAPPQTPTPTAAPQPTAPGAVSGIVVTFPKKKTALVAWNAPSGATSYRVRLSKKNSVKKFSAWKTTTKPSYKFTKLTKKGRYLVQIVARNSVGLSPTTSLPFRQAK